jgi:hypothetical protein
VNYSSEGDLECGVLKQIGIIPNYQLNLYIRREMYVLDYMIV